jgi:predicted nucleic acid-binding protein
MKPKVYVETSVVSYLTAWPSGDLIVAGRQKITRDWWPYALHRFELVVSELVIRESSAGDAQAIQDRLNALQNLPVLAVSPEADELAAALIAQRAIPPEKPEDALHIALAVVNGIEYLVTWNFKHIANASMRAQIEQVCRTEGFAPSTICSPEELAEETNNA